MPDRVPNPDPDPLVPRVRSGSEDVVALVGFVGEGAEGHLRIYADHHLQRWLDIPADAVVDSVRIEDDDPLGGRTMIWVAREAMAADVFDPDVFGALEAHFLDGGMSTWPLIPDTRYVAAAILGLLPRGPLPEPEVVYP